MELALAHWQRASFLRDRNQDPTGELRLAIEAAESVAPEDRDHEHHRLEGLVFDVWADHDAQVGADPLPHRGQAIAALLAAIAADGRSATVWINLGSAYFQRASTPHDPDPDRDLVEAQTALDEARAKNPGHFASYFFGGQVHARKAQRRKARGADPRPELGLAVDQYRQGIAVSPKVPQLHNWLGAVLLDEAREAWDRGGDPDPFLDQARAAFEAAVAAAPDQGYGYENLGYVHVKRALYDAARGDDPGPEVRASAPELRRAVDKMPDSAEPRTGLGEGQAILASFALDQGRDPAEPLAAATAALDEALARDPKNPQILRDLGEARATRARAARKSATPADFEAALEPLTKALDLAPEDPDTRLALGRLSLAWATWAVDAGHDPGPPLRRGLELCEALIAVLPDWPEARLLRAGLLVVQGKAVGGGEAQRALGARAVADFERALGVNPGLGRRWGSQVAAARGLAARGP